MTRGAGRVTAVSKSKASVYLGRARNLLAMMEEAESKSNGDGVAVNGIQAAISFCDAFTVAKLGLRARGQDHLEVVSLISRIPTAPASTLATLAQGVLGKKGEVEYGEQEVTLAAAARIATSVRKIGRLVSSELR